MSELANHEVKRLARESGLAVSSGTSAEPFAGLAELLKSRIDAGHLSGFDWFTHDRADVAANPRALHERARSIVAVGLPYWNLDTGKPDDGIPRGRISRYARGVDYHKTLKKRMVDLHRRIEESLGRTVESRQLVDTARISDRAVAERAGLGWFGKHTCIIVPGHGSWVMLGELLLDVEIAPDLPLDRDCGQCRICLDRCPTGAIVAPYTVDAPKCLSFQTIEQRGAIPREIRPLLGDWVFGCDVCQEVCPFNRTRESEPLRGEATREPDFLAKRTWPSLEALSELGEEDWDAITQGSPVHRAKLPRLRQVARANLLNAKAQRDDPGADGER